MLKEYSEEELLLLYTKKKIGRLYKIKFEDFVFDVRSVAVSPEERENPENLGKVVDKLLKSYKNNRSKNYNL